MSLCNVCYQAASLRCAGCKTAYCSRDHQILAYYAHKYICKTDKSEGFIHQPMLNDDEHQFMALLTPDSTLAANAFVPEICFKPYPPDEYITRKAQTIRILESSKSPFEKLSRLINLRVHAYINSHEMSLAINKKHRYLRPFYDHTFLVIAVDRNNYTNGVDFFDIFFSYYTTVHAVAEDDYLLNIRSQVLDQMEIEMLKLKDEEWFKRTYIYLDNLRQRLKSQVKIEKLQLQSRTSSGDSSFDYQSCMKNIATLRAEQQVLHALDPTANMKFS